MIIHPLCPPTPCPLPRRGEENIFFLLLPEEEAGRGVECSKRLAKFFNID